MTFELEINHDCSLSFFKAGVAQLVEHHLAKVDIEVRIASPAPIT